MSMSMLAILCGGIRERKEQDRQKTHREDLRYIIQDNELALQGRWFSLPIHEETS